MQKVDKSSAAQAEVVGAHEGSINAMAWHPLGHVLATGSSDLMTRFWTRAKADEGRCGADQAPSGTVMPEGNLCMHRWDSSCWLTPHVCLHPSSRNLNVV